MEAKTGNLVAVKLKIMDAFRATDQLGDFIRPGSVAQAPVDKR